MVNLTRRGAASLDHIKQPIDAELKEFGKFFRDAMRSRVGLIDLIARYIVRQKGKRVRPILVFLSAKACGEVNEETYRAATLVEILHTATLIHDDVVDDADTRRGLASINAVWKNKVAGTDGGLPSLSRIAALTRKQRLLFPSLHIECCEADE